MIKKGLSQNWGTNIFIRIFTSIPDWCNQALSNGPDKKESNNDFEHVGMQKGANFTIVFTFLLIGLNSKS